MVKENSEDQIELIWHIFDVQEVRPDLTDEEAREVLLEVKHGHDADIGVSWYTIKYWADELFPLDKEIGEDDE